jgi:hypothetical protein
VDKLSYVIFSLLEIKFLFGVGCLSSVAAWGCSSITSCYNPIILCLPSSKEETGADNVPRSNHAWFLHRYCKEQRVLVHNTLCHEASKKQKVVWCISVLRDHYNRAKKKPTSQNPCKKVQNKWWFSDSVITNAYELLIQFFLNQIAILILIISLFIKWSSFITLLPC